MVNLNNSLCLATAALSCSPPLTSTLTSTTAIADTGASDHYFTTDAPLLDINPAGPRTTIRTATGEAKASSATAVLAIPAIPTLAARTGHIIPGFTNNLLSLGKLCDADCSAYLDKRQMVIHDNTGKEILKGIREPTGARLWRVNITPPQTNLQPPLPAQVPHHKQPHKNPNPTTDKPQQQVPHHTQPHKKPNPTTKKPQQHTDTPPHLPLPTTDKPQLPIPTPNKPATTTITRTTTHARAYDLPSVPALIAYLHAAAGFPVKSTWLAAIKRGAYATWPGLTAGLVARYCPDAPETVKGHMAQPRQHIRSTQLTQPRTALTHPQDSVELHELPLNHLFTDDTGRFHPRSRSGNQYLMVALHTATNAILVRPFTSKHDTHRIPAYQDIYAHLAATGNAPREREITEIFKYIL